MLKRTFLTALFLFPMLPLVALADTLATSSMQSYKSSPTISLDPMQGVGLEDGRLIRFRASAPLSGPIQIGQFTFALRSSGVQVQTANLYGYTDPYYSNSITGEGLGGYIGTISPSGDMIRINGERPAAVSAGQTIYFELRGQLSGASSSVITTTLLGDASPATLSPLTAQEGVSNFVWSPDDNDISTADESDWTNGYDVAGLPAAGITQGRSISEVQMDPKRAQLASIYEALIPLLQKLLEAYAQQLSGN